MRKYLLQFVLVLTLLGVAISCEKEPPIPYCERENVGIVTVENLTGYPADVDVTWGNVVENYEAFLYDGESHTYLDVPAGRIEIWISFDGEEWTYQYEDLNTCEDMTFTWYLSARKSANGCPFVLDLGDGRLVVPTKKDKH